MALKVPLPALPCGFGGGSTNTEDTSVLAGLNPSASSGIPSSSATLGRRSTTNTEDTSMFTGLNSSASSGIASSSVTSTNTEDTSVLAGLNSAASPGIASSSVTLGRGAFACG